MVNYDFNIKIITYQNEKLGNFFFFSSFSQTSSNYLGTCSFLYGTKTILSPANTVSLFIFIFYLFYLAVTEL